MDEELEEIYSQVADQVTPEDFEARVEEKVALMAGLCDRRTAAMLVARDLGAIRGADQDWKHPAGDGKCHLHGPGAHRLRDPRVSALRRITGTGRQSDPGRRDRIGARGSLG